TAVATANAGGGTITFSCSGTIVFTSQLFITDDVIINGGGVITFLGSGSNRFFNVDPAGSFTVDGITFQGGANVAG
ncbi:MAG TPA: hypothetical protein PLZ51_15455, partial [Aggregatilineales bacterium]|nr:hypothetical protein [Aggregatilineales bacterium]